MPHFQLSNIEDWPDMHMFVKGFSHTALQARPSMQSITLYNARALCAIAFVPSCYVSTCAFVSTRMQELQMLSLLHREHNHI